MLSDIAIIVINLACIGCMVLLMAILVAATRFRGGAGWAAVMLAGCFHCRGAGT